jgi:GT2 family glycosyltransferase
MFSILIPTWNNLAMLQLCVQSIRQNSAFEHQIVLHINDGSDGTTEWATAENIAFTHSIENIGICKAVNWSFLKTEKDYIVYLNDDMLVLPDWDTELYRVAQQMTTPYYMLSATMIEPTGEPHSPMIVADYGRDEKTLRYDDLLREYKRFDHADWSGASWPPLLVSREAWATIGGFSIEFSPGMYSDPDFSMKLWQAGARVFRGVGAARVYHFQARSTGRVKRNNGRLQFMKKWGIPASAFYRDYLRMGQPYTNSLPEVQDTSRLRWARWKARWHSFTKS